MIKIYFTISTLILFVFFYNSNVKAADCSSTYSSSATFSANCTVPSGGTTITACDKNLLFVKIDELGSSNVCFNPITA